MVEESKAANGGMSHKTTSPQVDDIRPSGGRISATNNSRYVESFWVDGTRYLARIDASYDVAVLLRPLLDGEQVPDGR